MMCAACDADAILAASNVTNVGSSTNASGNHAVTVIGPIVRTIGCDQ